MPATVTTTRRHLNAATAVGGFKSQSAYSPHHRYNDMTFRRVYKTRIGRSCPAASRPQKEIGCHTAMDCVDVLDSSALDVARSFAWPASSPLRDCVPSRVCCAPRRQTIDLPLSDDPIEKLIFQWDGTLNLKAPEGEGALGLLL